MKEAVLHSHITHIVEMTAKKKMRRIDAERNVATMANVWAVYRDLSNKQLITDTMCEIASPVPPECTITLSMAWASPQPAAVPFLRVSPKEVNQWLRLIVRCLAFIGAVYVAIRAAWVSMKDDATALARIWYGFTSHVRSILSLWLGPGQCFRTVSACLHFNTK